jgi:hypothetical protein
MVKRPTPAVNDDNNGDDNGDEVVARFNRKIDPFVRALLNHLPPPKSVWPPADRQKWLQLLSESFGVIYKDAPDPPKGAASGPPQHPPGPVSPPGRS